MDQLLGLLSKTTPMGAPAPEKDPLAEAAGPLFAPPPAAPAPQGNPLAQLAGGLFSSAPAAAPAPAEPGMFGSLAQMLAPRPAAPAPQAQPVEPLAQPALSQPVARGPITRGEITARTRGEEQAQLSAIDREREAQAAKDRFVAEQKAAALRTDQQARDTIVQERMQAEAAGQASLDRIKGEVERIGQEKTDTGKHFKDIGGLGSALQLIGVALGGYASAKTGQNPALNLVMRQIDQSIDAQGRDRQSRLAAAQEKRGLAKEQTQAAINLGEWKLARQVEAYNTLIQQIDVQAAKYNDPIIQARAEAEKAKIRQTITDKLEGQRSNAVAEAQRGQQIAQAERFHKDEMGFREKQLGLAGLEAQSRAAAEEAKLAKEDRVRQVNIGVDTKGQPVLAPNTETAVKLNDGVASAQAFVMGIDRLRQLREEHGFELSKWTSEAKREAEGLTRQLETDYALLKGQGAISDSDAKRYGEIFGDPNAVVSNVPNLMSLRGRTLSAMTIRVERITGHKIPMGVLDPAALDWRPGTTAGRQSAAAKKPMTVEETLGKIDRSLDFKSLAKDWEAK